MTKEDYIKAFESIKPRADFEEETERLLRSVSAERDNMKNKKFITVFITAVLAVVLMAGTVYAAAVLLSPSQVAKDIGDSSLAQAFESEAAVVINETQQTGDYNITFMGVVSGKNLSRWHDVDEEYSYAAIAVERTDGKPMTHEEGAALHISPLIEGYQPWAVNLFTLSNGANGLIDNGIYYYLFTFESLEIFADREVAFYAYSGGMAPSNEIFTFDEETGEINYHPFYRGIRAVFTLPLDESKADPQKAREFLEGNGFVLNEDGSLNFEE